MKEFYTSPIAELERFDLKDVITTSGGSTGTGDPKSDNTEGEWTGLF